MRRVTAFFISIIFLVFVFHVSAGDILKPSPISAYAKQIGKNEYSPEYLYKCLNRVTSRMQMVAANDRDVIRGGNCWFGEVPVKDTKVRWKEFYESETHIFPAFFFVPSKTSFRYYSTDNIFSKDYWYVEKKHDRRRDDQGDKCTRQQIAVFGGCIMPVSCEILDKATPALLAEDGVGYMKFPSRCMNFSGGTKF